MAIAASASTQLQCQASGACGQVNACFSQRGLQQLEMSWQFKAEQPTSCSMQTTTGRCLLLRHSNNSGSGNGRGREADLRSGMMFPVRVIMPLTDTRGSQCPSGSRSRMGPWTWSQVWDRRA